MIHAFLLHIDSIYGRSFQKYMIREFKYQIVEALANMLGKFKYHMHDLEL